MNKILSYAPGRVCLFGDHQDYLELPVIACAIDRIMQIDAEENGKDHFEINMPDMGQQTTIKLEPDFSKIERGNSLLWIDVEGHEGFVFKGAKGILSKNLPCVMELCPYMIRRSGMEIEEYISIIQEYWKEFWIIREFKIVNYPTSVLRNFIDEFEEEGSYQNIILTS